MNQGGEIPGNRRIVSEDRISELPENLILQILSLLPTKLVIATSVLSKKWRSHWTMAPCLDFEAYGYGVAENVCKSLISNKAPVLESLQLKVRDRCEVVSMPIGVFAGIAFTRNVREFVLQISPRYGPYGDRIRFPSSLLCLDKLEILKLKDCIFLDFPSLVSIKSLKTLHLHSVVYRDDASVRNLISSCPNLEHLVVHRGSRSDNVVTFAIVAPSLKTLSLHSVLYGGGNKGYVINAPSLKLLIIESLKGIEFVRIENEFDELVEANVKNVSCNDNEMIMGSLRSAKRLSLDLSPLQITYPSEVSFYQLVYIEMYTHEKEWWNLLTLMLDSSPKLRVLKLIDQLPHPNNYLFEDKYMDADAEKWSQPKYVPECLLSHLETFVWIGNEWILEAEREVAKYILRNAKQLKKAIFVMHTIESKDFFRTRLKRRQEMLVELNGVVKASSSCQLSFEPE